MHSSISATPQTGYGGAEFRMHTRNRACDVITHNWAHEGFCLCSEQASMLLKVRMLLRVHIVRETLPFSTIREHQPGTGKAKVKVQKRMGAHDPEVAPDSDGSL